MSLAKRAGDLWVGRYVKLNDSVRLARAEVAYLKPIVAVTGGSRGIGAALAQCFAEAGNDVAIIARDRKELEAAAALILAGTGRTVLAIVCDITSPTAAEDVDRSLTTGGFYLDVLVNNAATGISGEFEHHENAELDQVIGLNITALSRLMRHALRSMRARQQGGILNVASLGGVGPCPYQSVYYASKAYVMSLTEAVAAEAPGNGVRISVLAPGPVDTGFHAAMGTEGARYRRFLPALSPERVARSAYRGFTIGECVIVPGFFNRVLYGCLRLLPHPITVPVVTWLLRPPKK